MDGLQVQIISGTAVAIKAAKEMLTTPTLINTDITQGDIYSLPLECETYQQEGSAEVSESLILIYNGKEKVSDNVAPGTYTWSLSGYIPGMPSETTNIYTPFVRLHTNILQNWFKKGAVLTFKDIECKLHKKVVIQRLKVSHTKDCRNKMPFSMTLKEINTMDDTTVSLSLAQQNALPATGSALLGFAAGFGSTAVSIVAGL